MYQDPKSKRKPRLESEPAVVQAARAGQDSAAVQDAAAALFRLGRLFGRQSLRERIGQAESPDLARVLVTQAVADGGDGLSVGELALALGVDPSTASRLVAQTVKAGYLERVPAAHDGRAVSLRLTPQGQALAASARDWQVEIFARATEAWSAQERIQFAQLFRRFADGVSAMLESERA